MKRIFVLLALAALFVSVTPSTKATTIYTTDGDAHTMWIIDTVADTATSVDTSAISEGYPPAVFADRIELENVNGGGAAEFLRSGTPTGATYPGLTLPYALGASTETSLLDGATDGTAHNYAAVWQASPSGPHGGDIIVTDRHWQNASVLFNAGFDHVYGMTYDTNDGTFYVINEDDSVIHHYDSSGSELGTFSGGSANCCLAYDPVANSIWAGKNGTGTLYEYSTSGSLLNTITPTGYNPSNQYGAAIAVSQSLASSVPAASPTGLAAIALLLAIAGSFIIQRH